MKWMRAVPVLSAAALCLLLAACENSQKSIDDLTKKVIMKEEATQVEAYLSQIGHIKAKLTAPVMYRVMADTPYVEFTKTMHVDFFDSLTRVDTRLDCKYAKYFENLGKVYLRDSVLVVTVHGDTLKSPDLWWDQNAKIFYTEQYAIYHGIGKQIYGGRGLRATQDLSSVIFNDPTGTVQVSSNGFPAN